MKIVICSSIDFTPLVSDIAVKLKELGHIVEIPQLSKKILNGDLAMEDFLSVKEKFGDKSFRLGLDHDPIKFHYNLIKEAEAILVVNSKKKGVENYIGGNTFLEIGFAYTLEKKIFFLNPIPDMTYRDELEAMCPIILNNDLLKIN